MNKSHVDIHSWKAKQMFNLPCSVEQVKEEFPQHRKLAKIANYVEAYSCRTSFGKLLKNV